MDRFKHILVPLLQVTLFFFIYYEVANFIIYYFVWPEIESLPIGVRQRLEPYLALDYGRVLERIFRFFWALLIFWGAERLINRCRFRNTILFRTKNKVWSLLRGALFGGVMVSSLIALSFLSGTIDITHVKIKVTTLLSTILLYGICMTLTAIAQELTMRGFILKHLIDRWGIHTAIWTSAALFGLVHLSESLYYAYMAFVSGILLGYIFAWQGIYYCIGWHFAWNFIESVFYSGKIIQFQVNNPYLAGQKFISPDQEGLLALPVLLIGFALLLTTHKTEWRLT